MGTRESSMAGWMVETRNHWLLIEWRYVSTVKSQLQKQCFSIPKSIRDMYNAPALKLSSSYSAGYSSPSSSA
jgi:hypothetical protein